MPLLSICVPVYNEQDNLPLLHQAVVDVCDPKQIDFELLLVDDGSKDNSWAEIEKVSAKDPRVRGLKFKFNCGETAASDAGLRAARGKYVMTMDADLQNDPNDIPAFLEALDKGDTDCVCGTRVATRGKGDNFKSASPPAASPTGCATSSPTKTSPTPAAPIAASSANALTSSSSIAACTASSRRC